MMTYHGQDNEDALQHQISALEEQQRQLLTQIRGSIAALSRANPQPSTPTPVPVQQTRKERQLMQLLAEIERRVQLENSRFPFFQWCFANGRNTQHRPLRAWKG